MTLSPANALHPPCTEDIKARVEEGEGTSAETEIQGFRVLGFGAYGFRGLGALGLGSRSSLVPLKGACYQV